VSGIVEIEHAILVGVLAEVEAGRAEADSTEVGMDEVEWPMQLTAGTVDSGGKFEPAHGLFLDPWR